VCARGHHTGTGGLPQRPRHRHAAKRQHRSRGHQSLGRRAGGDFAGQFDQGEHRPSARRGGRSRSAGLPDDTPRTMAAAGNHAVRHRPRLWFSHREPADRCPRERRTLKFLRLRRRKRNAHFSEVDMSRVFVHGIGAVSPAGWGVPTFRGALEKGAPLPTQALTRPGRSKPFQVRLVPEPARGLAFLAHPRLRRASAITQYAIGASCEALGEDLGRVQNGELRLGIVVCLMPGCVTYSRRFYEEVLDDPATASPLIFAETVYNAPASHLAAFLNSGTVSYTLVGDDGSFLQGVALAADWLLNDQADGCLIIGANEMDWIVADAVHLFERQSVQGAGAGALYLRKECS